MDYQVTCIRRDGRDQDRRIDRLGGPQFNDTIDAVIAAIRQGHTFWTSVNGYRAEVVIKTHPQSWRPYLATAADNYPHNNLLNLPECP